MTGVNAAEYLQTIAGIYRGAAASLELAAVDGERLSEEECAAQTERVVEQVEEQIGALPTSLDELPTPVLDRNGEPVSEEDLAQWERSGFDRDEAASWIEADLTIDMALGWREHGCGPGDALGCWTQDPEEAFADSPDEDDSESAEQA